MKNRSTALPLLDFVDSLYENLELSNCILIACQNLLGSTVTLIDHLLAKGLPKDNIFILGKAYSTNTGVVSDLEERGIYVSPLSTRFRANISFDHQFYAYVNSFLNEIKAKISLSAVSKIIILDEGHQLLQKCSTYFPKEMVIGVEQSTKSEVLTSKGILFPCVVVSRSLPKLFVESPMIAELVVNQICSYADENKIDLNEVLIIGGGYIGQATANEFRKLGIQTNIYDRNHDKTQIPTNQLAKFVEKANSIVSCVYGNALDRALYECINNQVILASASLSDRAFAACEFRKKSEQSFKNCHENIILSNASQIIHLLNGGFPVNFSGSKHSVPPKKIQLTRALLLAGVYEAVSTDNKAVHPLPDCLQDKILNKFFEVESSTKIEYSKFLTTYRTDYESFTFN